MKHVGTRIDKGYTTFAQDFVTIIVSFSSGIVERAREVTF
jgi:hypothetical protein